MKVSIVQYDIRWDDRSANVKRCRSFFEKASAAGSELLVFPEMTLTGFSVDTSLAEPPDGDTCSFFGRMSKQYGVPSVFGYTEREGDIIRNRLAFADADGRITARYAKMHPFSIGGESGFTNGTQPVSFSLCGMEIGMTICYDLRFPELYQQLSKSCDAVIVSACWPASRREHWLTLLRARAIENQCYIIGCNRIGSEIVISYSGDSVIFAPDGSQICCAGSDEILLTAQIDRMNVENLRSEFPMKNDRKIDIYRNFYE